MLQSRFKEENCSMRINRAVLASLAMLVISAASSGPVFAQSAVTCDAYARQYSQNASRQGQVVGGGVVGSLVGLGIGAAAGGAGTGAAIGAGVGAIAGGAKRRQTADRMYQAAYSDCMAGRIH
jgi:hypothetical protein